MRMLLGAMIVFGLAATPALAQKVYIDYAKEYDFDKLETYQYVETKDTDAADPLMGSRIVFAIKNELEEGGLEEVEENPDIYVTYHVTTEENQVFSTTSYGYGGWGPGWGAWGVGVGSSSTTVSTSTEGTLIIDAYEAVDKRLVWRGTGTVTVKADPEKRSRQLDKILIKLGDKWDKILAKQGK